MIDKNTIPEHWEVKKLGEICEKVQTVKRKEKYLDEELLYLDIGGINNTANKIIDHKVFQWRTAPSRAQQIVYKGDILFSTVRTYLKNIALVDQDIYNGQIASSGFCVIRGNKDVVDSKFLFYTSLSDSFLRPLNKLQTGSSYPAVRDKDVFSQLIPLPPLSEQQEIVAKIEELLSELDNGKEQLEIARQQLKVYRQAVLKWAFEGKLTNPEVKEGELPEGWEWVKVEDVAKTYGGFAFKSGDFLPTGRYQVLRMGNVRPGILRFEESPVYLEKVDDNTLNKALLKINDVIITQTGTRQKRDYGFTALINKNNLLLNQRLAAIRFNENYLPKFFLYFSWTDNFKNQFFANETGNVGQGNVGMKAVTQTLIPSVPIEEQQQIVQEIESRLSVCDKVEETITQSLQQAETLRQSILKKAFEGKLVKEKVEVTQPKNVYFYQVQLLVYLIHYSNLQGIHHGEMTAAKYAYLLHKIYGIKTYYNYKRWHLGPYAPEMKKVVNNKKFFSWKDNGLSLVNPDSILNYANPVKEQVEKAIDELSQLFASLPGKTRSHKTELFATVCKVIEDIQSADLQAIRASMADWKIDLPTTHFKSKAEKFNEQETEECLQVLIKKGWDKKIINS